MGVDHDSDKEASWTLFIGSRENDAFKSKSFSQCVPSMPVCPHCPPSQHWQFWHQSCKAAKWESKPAAAGLQWPPPNPLLPGPIASVCILLI